MARSNLDFKLLYSHPVDRSTGVMCDQTILLAGINTPKDYPDKLRRIRYYDKEKNKRLTFLTNNFIIPSLTIARIYKNRWQIELFFKRMKQHLRIKGFYGTSENALKTQIWIAISIYVLMAIIKKQLKINLSLYTFLQIMSVSIFEKVHILQLVTENTCRNLDNSPYKQLELFDL